jgi:pyruvyltransferase
MNELFYRLTGRATKIIGDLRGNLIEAFWFIKVRNAGDLVTPFLLRQYGFTPKHSWPPKAQIIGCGSLLSYLTEEYDGYILGSGFLRDGERLPIPKAHMLAIRGVFSRDRIGAPASTPLGDPGLLMAKFCPARLPKKHILGILPHYVDKEYQPMINLMRRYPKETHFIDIQTSPEEVMAEIDQCEYILSSSLHGCIFADALKVPVIWPIVPGHEEERNFKFADYASIFTRGLTASPLNGDETLSTVLAWAFSPSADEVDAAIERLDKSFLVLKEEFGGK